MNGKHAPLHRSDTEGLEYPVESSAHRLLRPRRARSIESGRCVRTGLRGPAASAAPDCTGEQVLATTRRRRSAQRDLLKKTKSRMRVGGWGRGPEQRKANNITDLVQRGPLAERRRLGGLSVGRLAAIRKQRQRERIK